MKALPWLRRNVLIFKDCNIWQLVEFLVYIVMTYGAFRLVTVLYRIHRSLMHSCPLHIHDIYCSIRVVNYFGGKFNRNSFNILQLFFLRLLQNNNIICVNS